jgi:hypothetical protein
LLATGYKVLLYRELPDAGVEVNGVEVNGVEVDGVGVDGVGVDGVEVDGVEVNGLVPTTQARYEYIATFPRILLAARSGYKSEFCSRRYVWL